MLMRTVPLFMVAWLACSLTLHAQQRDLDAVLKDGKLRICVRSDIPPFGFLQDFQQVGFDIDLAKAVAEQIQTAQKKKLAVSWETISAKQRLGHLQFGLCDFLVGTFSKTPEREKIVNFSTIYLDTRKVIISRRKVENPKPVLALIHGTTAQGQMALGVNRYFNTYTSAIAAMKRGEVDFMVVDLPIANFIIKRISSAFYITQRLDDRERYAIGVKKGNDKMLAAVNQALKVLKAKGTLKKLSKKWL